MIDFLIFSVGVICLAALAFRLGEASGSKADADGYPPAPGEARLEHPEYGPYSVVETDAGPSWPIFRSLGGYRAWELAGRPPLPRN